MKNLSVYVLGGVMSALTFGTLTSCEPEPWHEWGGDDDEWYDYDSNDDQRGDNSDNHGGTADRDDGNTGRGDHTSVVDGCWRGTVNYYNKWDGHTYSNTEIEFVPSVIDSNSGTGYWVDYYDGFNSGYYVYNTMKWTATNDCLNITLDQEKSNFTIQNYNFTDSSFGGTIYYNNNPITFELQSITSPYLGTWNKYTLYSASSDAKDSTSLIKSNAIKYLHLSRVDK